MDAFFFGAGKAGKFTIVLTDLTLRELLPAPERVRKLTETIPD